LNTFRNVIVADAAELAAFTGIACAELMGASAPLTIAHPANARKPM
jgi:hypothetical protein